jgi:hypothetical protein
VGLARVRVDLFSFAHSFTIHSFPFLCCCTVVASSRPSTIPGNPFIATTGGDPTGHDFRIGVERLQLLSHTTGPFAAAFAGTPCLLPPPDPTCSDVALTDSINQDAFENPSGSVGTSRGRVVATQFVVGELGVHHKHDTISNRVDKSRWRAELGRTQSSGQ